MKSFFYTKAQIDAYYFFYLLSFHYNDRYCGGWPNEEEWQQHEDEEQCDSLEGPTGEGAAAQEAGVGVSNRTYCGGKMRVVSGGVIETPSHAAAEVSPRPHVFLSEESHLKNQKAATQYENFGKKIVTPLGG